MEQIDWNHFEKVEMRVGTILDASPFPKARKPAYKLSIDFGEHGIKRSSAQITDQYSEEELIGKQIIAVLNFPTKQIADFMSECLVMGAIGDPEGVVLLSPDKRLKNGLRIA